MALVVPFELFPEDVCNRVGRNREDETGQNGTVWSCK